MKIIIIGSKGQLGRELVSQSKNLGFEILGADLPQLDITNIIQVENTITNFQPSLVINAAAYTDVDKAETEQSLAFAVNSDGPTNLAVVCANSEIPIVHISSDYVFDGQKGTPYIETDPVSPLGVYGKSKTDGEKKIRFNIKNHIILRTSWLYGVHGHNFVKTMLTLGKEKETIPVVVDQFGSPTCAADLAETVLTIAARIQKRTEIDWGTYHYCGQGVTSWHGFAETIFTIARPYASIITTNIEPITTDKYPTRAKRPSFSALDCSLIKKRFGISPKPWQGSLKITIDRILRGN